MTDNDAVEANVPKSADPNAPSKRTKRRRKAGFFRPTKRRVSDTEKASRSQRGKKGRGDVAKDFETDEEVDLRKPQVLTDEETSPTAPRSRTKPAKVVETDDVISDQGFTNNEGTGQNVTRARKLSKESLDTDDGLEQCKDQVAGQGTGSTVRRARRRPTKVDETDDVLEEQALIVETVAPMKGVETDDDVERCKGQEGTDEETGPPVRRTRKTPATNIDTGVVSEPRTDQVLTEEEVQFGAQTGDKPTEVVETDDELKLRKDQVVSDGGTSLTVRRSQRRQTVPVADPVQDTASERDEPLTSSLTAEIPPTAPDITSPSAVRASSPTLDVLESAEEMSDQGDDIVRLHPSSGGLAGIPKFSQAVVFSNLCYLAGQTAADTVSAAGQTYKGQAEQVLAAVEALLRDVGSSKSRLLQVLVHLKDMEEGAAAFNEVWEAWLPQHALPARTMVEGALVREELLVEVTAVAAMHSAEELPQGVVVGEALVADVTPMSVRAVSEDSDTTTSTGTSGNDAGAIVCGQLRWRR